MSSFFKYALPSVLFYISGDYLSTLWALHRSAGYETNTFMAGLVSSPALFLAAKLLILAPLYIFYKNSPNSKIYPLIPCIAGMFLTVNNLCVTLFAFDLLP